ncbi:MAG TPA: hypothetical protein VGJ78_14560 [Vicinamibacterales bacterium]|jgi:hypothetical protein
MIPTTWRAGRLGAAALLLAVLWPSSAFSQDEAFKRGLDAREKKNWNAAVTEMRQAIANESKESTRKVGGGFLRGGTEYVPHYFLGEALYNLNDCAGAVTEWAISEQQPVVGTVREFKAFMTSGYRLCAMRGVLPPAEYAPQFASASQAVNEANALAERVTRLGNADAWRQDLRDQYARIGTDLMMARTRLDAGTRTRSAPDFEAARAAATRAANGLRAFEGALNASIENLSAVQRQAREVDQVINGAESNDRAIDALKEALPQSLTATRQNGRDLLARARDQVRTGERTQNIAAVTEASQSAQQAAAILEQVLIEATKIARGALEHELADAGAAASEALSFLDSSLATLVTLFRDKPAMVTPDVQAQRDALDKRVTAIRRRVEAAQKSQNAGALKEAARLAADARTDLEKLVTSFGPLSLRTRGVQAALEDGARQFFAGEYRQALATLDSESLTDAPLQLHVHLFRAAALYHLFVRSGEKDQALRTRALAEIDACRKLNSQFTPDSRAFAPRFLAFYQNAAPAAP